MPGAPRDGDRVGVDFSQCGSGKGKQTEVSTEYVKYMGSPSCSEKINRSSSWRNQIKATKKSYGTGTQMAEKIHPSSSHQGKK